MHETIVAGVDGAEGGRDALALGARLVQATGARLVLVCAYPYEHSMERALSPGFGEELGADARRMLEREREAAGVEAELVVSPDPSPARALHAVAEREGAGLIALGASHRGVLGRVLIGDVARATLHGAPCAVAVAPRGEAAGGRGLATIGAGFDGSADGHAALDAAARLARTAGATLRALAVVPEPLPVAVPYGLDHTFEPAGMLEELKAQREAEVARAIGALGGVTASATTVVGDPARELERLSGEVDLLVVGSRGFGPVMRVLVGSTSDHLVRHAACPVVVVPRAPGDAAR